MSPLPPLNVRGGGGTLRFLHTVLWGVRTHRVPAPGAGGCGRVREGEHRCPPSPPPPRRTMSVRGAQNGPLFCGGSSGWRGDPAPGSGHVGALAGRDPAPPGKRSAGSHRSSLRARPRPAAPRRATFLSTSRAAGSSRGRGAGGRGAGGRSRGAALAGAHLADAPSGRAPGTLTCGGRVGRSVGWLGEKRSAAGVPCALCSRARGFVRIREGVSRPRPPVGSALSTLSADVRAPAGGHPSFPNPGSSAPGRWRGGESGGRRETRLGPPCGPTVRSEPPTGFPSARWYGGHVI